MERFFCCGIAAACALMGAALLGCNGRITPAGWDSASPVALTDPRVTPVSDAGAADAALRLDADFAHGAEAGAAIGGDSEAPLPMFCDAPRRVFMASCGNGSCHSNPGVVIGDFAVAPDRGETFVDQISIRDPSCGRIIDSRNYADSLLLTKVTGSYPPQCGGRMPPGSFIITDAQISCLASWLQQFQR